MQITRLIFLFYLNLMGLALDAQTEMDTTIDNLVHPSGYLTSEWGSLSYETFGTGTKPLLVLPGTGFDANVFKSFIENHREDFTIYVIALPGYANTQAYPMPSREESYSEQNWTNGVMTGILNLIKEKELVRPAVVAHYFISPHIALRLAAEHGDEIGKVVVIGAPAEVKSPPPYDTLGYANRVKFTDKYLAPMWFKTVSRETWLDGNFTPDIFSQDTVSAKHFWELANEAPLPVHIQYLCENWCVDYSKYKTATIPVLVMVPSFQSEQLAATCNSYLEYWSMQSWKKIIGESRNFKLALVENSACHIMHDQPDVFDRLMMQFLNE